MHLRVDSLVENEDGKMIYYNKIYGGVEITYKEHSQPSYFGDIVIPPSITVDGIRYPVTCIGYDAFRDCVALTSIKLPNSIITIDGFAGCSGLKSIEMPNTITSIGASAFMNCSSLESIKIPYWVQDILPETFKGCSGLKSIEMPYRITSIGDWAFYGCSSLESIELPNSIKYIGEFVFSGCSSLASIEIPSSITSIGWYTFYGCSGLKSIEIPNSITSIGMSAFEECSSLTSVEIPNSVTFIGRRAFSGCISLERFIGKFSSMDQRYLIVNDTLISFAPAGLTTYTNPNPVTTIGGGAFWGCRELTAIEIPNTVKSIETSAFAKSGIKNISIPNSVDTIDSYAFRECRELTSVKMPNSLKHFRTDAFWDCPKLKEFIGELASEDHRCLIINDTLRAFAPADLTTYTIPTSVTSIGGDVFRRCRELTSIVIPNSVISIGGCAFAECSGLESIVIPNSVTSIGSQAFWNCSSLASIEIPYFTTSIGSETFWGCVGLKSVDVSWTSLDNVECEKSAFRDIQEKCTLYAPLGTKELYKSTSPWSNFKYIVEKPSFCKSPVITIQNNELVVTCETKDAEIHTTITSDDINTFNHKSGDVIPLTGQYLVTSYATVGGNGQSEHATAVLVWSKAADIETGVNAIDMNTDRALLIHSVGENIEIAGTLADEAISLYNMSGQQLYTGKSTANATTISVALTRGEIYIIKIGEQSIKYKF